MRATALALLLSAALVGPLAAPISSATHLDTACSRFGEVPEDPLLFTTLRQHVPLGPSLHAQSEPARSGDGSAVGLVGVEEALTIRVTGHGWMEWRLRIASGLEAGEVFAKGKLDQATTATTLFHGDVPDERLCFEGFMVRQPGFAYELEFVQPGQSPVPGPPSAICTSVEEPVDQQTVGTCVFR